ncbi:hypothetical protein ASPZODRAFT_1621167 [Penicilliopsis zonata CBS 506.65]|uniref:Uncharacterized protein n=1 Tax=Penicilliopsis zonata CBS 506.65 TaxID=1073090 RepID=A0A1L9SN74_9EURO|nr:hypothetical protein ASPZODRAFT_1621167 [Penicilliopsis zonata CBS 506.65]OJJ48551.1 hypothetical protein ASPZODRAFT_1621167 [Penicilliopsis zonata CBS 506.65]
MADTDGTPLLWAYQLRRENVYLAEQLESTSAALDLNTSTANELKKTVKELRTCIQKLESENATLKLELESLEGSVSMHLEDLVARLQEVELEFQPGPKKAKKSNRLTDSTINDSDVAMVPDSMPSNPSIHQPNEGERPSEPDMRHLLSQNQRTLSDYFSFAESVRTQLPPSKREGVLVEAFLTGLRFPGARHSLGIQLDEHGWTWMGLKTALQQFMKHQDIGLPIGTRPKSKSMLHGKSGKARNDAVCPPQQHEGKENISVNMNVVDGYAAGKTGKKRRRCISIVPPDEEW